MNENEMTELLHRATRDLVPDVDALVAGGLQRGLVRRRRRRTAAAVGAGAAAVLVTAGALQLLGDDSVRGRVVLPADTPSATPTTPTTRPSSPAPTPSAGPTARARLAVTTEQVPATFASLEPGRVSAPEPKSGPDSAPVVDFTWNGFGIRVGLTPDDYATGERVTDPWLRCNEDSPAPDSCRPGPDGSVVSTSAGVNPPVDGGATVWSAQVFRADGWDVLVMEYNGPGKEGPPTADRPPFSVEELLTIAASDVWFR